jgi:hypothetical protein
MFKLLGQADNKLFTKADRSGAVRTRQKESWDKALVTRFARTDQERSVRRAERWKELSKSARKAATLESFKGSLKHSSQ